MLVFGGRRRVLAALLGGAFAGFALTLGAGCGSRTSMLDADAYASSYAGGSSSSAGGSLAAAGSGATAVGGSASTSTAGAGSAAGNGSVDVSVAEATCKNYCPGYGTQCRQRLQNPDCLATCESELNNYGATCQALGVQTLNCLTPFFTPNASNCDAAVNRALGKCMGLVKQFDLCKKTFRPTSAPAPSASTAAPASDPEHTNLMGCTTLLQEATSHSCQHVFDCNDSPYIINCHSNNDSMLAACECSGPKGTLQVAVPAVSDPCPLAVDSCY